MAKGQVHGTPVMPGYYLPNDSRGKLPVTRSCPRRTSYFLAGAAGAAGVEEEAGAAGAVEVTAFLACFLCFFTFAGFSGVVVVAASVVAAGFGFAVALSAWPAKDRAAARAVPNIKAVKRFMLFISP
jgi:hypothetical protein